jgi:uncharacterized delta-60 repeat protein
MSSFGTNGIVTTAIGSGDDYGNSVAIQSDGKIVVAGHSYNGTNHDFAVVRYNTDGSLDTNFGNSGKVTTAIGSTTDIGYSVEIQSDGKIVVAGYSDNGSNEDIVIVRYYTDGSLDTTFGGNNNGIVTTAIGSGDERGYSVAIQSDNKLVVAGSTFDGSMMNFAVVRYNTDGSLDTTFGGDGKVTTDISEGTPETAGALYYGDSGKEVVIQSDGKIVVVGYSHTGSNTFGDNDIAVVRYNTDGSLDTGFGTGGKVTTAIGIREDEAHAVVIQSDNKIVIAGRSKINSNHDFIAVRYNTNGSLDTSFGTDGKVNTAFGTRIDNGWAMALQSDGKIVVAGTSQITGTTYDFSLVRYKTDGSLDETFGTGGKVTTDGVGSQNDRVYDIAIQSDGKIVVAGHSYNGTNHDFAVVRYNTDGSLDDSSAIGIINSGTVISNSGTGSSNSSSTNTNLLLIMRSRQIGRRIKKPNLKSNHSSNSVGVCGSSCN